MAKFHYGDSIFDTERAKRTFEGNTGSEWAHETLYQSQKGRYYVVRSSRWQGVSDCMDIISESQAVAWLILNDHEDEIPEDLKQCVGDVVE